MRYVKPHYYDDFKCIDKACPATCCAGWQIVIDESSLEKYGRADGGFGNRLKNSIDWEEGIFFQYDGRCAFLNENGLCDLQCEWGEEGLCDTCRRYPRHVEEYDGLREYSLSLSCPEAARMMLTDKEKTKFLQWETDEEDDFDEFDFLMFTQLEDARDIMFRIIQDRNIDLRIRMNKILEFARKLQVCVDEERFFEVDDVIREYEEWQKNNPKERRVTSAEAESEAKDFYYEKVRDFSVFYKLEHLNKSWSRRLDETWANLFDGGENHYREIYEKFQREWGYKSAGYREWERVGEQLLVFFIYTYFCGAVYDDMVYSKAALAVFSVRWIQEFFMALWVKKQGKVGMDELIETAYSYAREVEHSDLNLDILEKIISVQPVVF